MIRTLFITFILLAKTAFSISQSEAEASAKTGDQCFSEKNFKEAIQHYQQALTYAPSFQVYFNLGQSYAANEQYGFALAYFLKAQKISPHASSIQRIISQLYHKDPTLLKQDLPWYHDLFQQLSWNTWCILCSFCFWGMVGILLYHFIFRRTKRNLIMGIGFGFCFSLLGLLLLFEKQYQELCLLPQATVAHFAPTETSPKRYDWAPGTYGWIKTERQDYYFVSTIQGEDGWICKKDIVKL